MQPIPPPPRYSARKTNRSRAQTLSASKMEESRERTGFLATLLDNSSVKNWVPFSDGDESGSSNNRTSSSFYNSEMDISTSWSGESDDREGIEIELGPPSMKANDSVNWDWASKPISDENIEPVPLPTAPSGVLSAESFVTSSSHRTGTSAATEPMSNLTNDRRHRRDMRPAGIPPVRNRNYVKRIGLSDKRGGNEDGSESVDENSQSRGRQSCSRSTHRARSSSRARSNSRAPRQGRSRSVAKGEKSKDSKRSRRARSIARLGRSRTNNAKIDETDSNLDTFNEADTRRHSSTREIDCVKSSRPPLPSSPSPRQLEEPPSLSLPPIDNSAILIDSSLNSSEVGANTGVRTSVCLPRPIHTRNLLTTSVYHNQQTDIWITTINMSQKDTVTKSNAAKYLKAFSFQTEHEARESAYANAPAKMIPFDESPHCFVCDAKFAVFRRASHCRNCGVCICSSCSVTWNKVCIPETYNIKNEHTVKVCKSCNSLSRMFRRALLEANYEEALTIYNTGNINLRCPFMVGKGDESSLPVHCAVEGGSLELLQWLVDHHFCPIKRIRTGNNRNKSQSSDELITTSKGRSVVEIAMGGNTNVNILRYLVNEKNVSVAGIKDLSIALSALETVLKASSQPQQPLSTPTAHAVLMSDINTPERNRINDGLPSYAIDGADDDCTISDDESPRNDSSLRDNDDESVATTVRDQVSSISLNLIDFSPIHYEVRSK